MTDHPPHMLQRPSEPPDPLPPLRGNNGFIAQLHTEWARVHATSLPATSLAGRLRRRVGREARRVALRPYQALLGDLVRAVDAVAARCDELSNRLVNVESGADDLVRTLGEEVTHLRASVDRMAQTGPSSPRP